MAKETAKKEMEIIIADTPKIFADRIINVAFGPVVSKLVLCNETQPNTFQESYTIVIPTSALIDAVNFIQATLHGTPDLKKGMIETLDVLKKQIEDL
jgi:hypothetical protein